MIILSFRHVLRLAHALNCDVNFYFYSSTRLKVFFNAGSEEIDSVSVTLDYAQHWFPIIMGVNCYRLSIISRL